MGRYRFLIERGPGESVFLTTLTPGDDSGYGFETGTAEEARRLAQQSATLDLGEARPLRWREPPEEWKPAALELSEWLDDGVRDGRDG